MTVKPNILCFVTDQQRADHLGCAGNPDVRTPNLDALAADGLRFTRSYVSNPVCSPNRASLFTGQFPSHHGLRENGNALPADALTLPGVLKEHGYQTCSSGKLHLAPYGVTKDQALPESWFAEEVWCADVPEDQHYNAQIADRMIAFIEERDPDKPFFGWCSFPDPHHPFSPPEPWYSMYSGEEMTTAPVPDEGDERLPEELRAIKKKMRVAPDELNECIAKNYGMISMVDQQVGRVVASLKEQGLYDDTIIVFLSDHGDYMGDHGLLRKGLLPYDGLYRVPTLWRIPETGRARGVTDALCGSVDLMPTLLDLAHIEIPESVQGVSQAPVLRNQRPAVRETVFAEFDDSPSGQRVRFLRDDRYSFAYFFGLGYGMLYDMDIDPDQQTNLFNNSFYRDVRERFLGRLDVEAIENEPWLPAKASHA